jgi:hypothetical protein
MLYVKGETPAIQFLRTCRSSLLALQACCKKQLDLAVYIGGELPPLFSLLEQHKLVVGILGETGDHLPGWRFLQKGINNWMC